MKILRHCYLLVAFLFAAGLGSARAQSFAWAKLARAPIDTIATTRTSATDANGNTYVYTQYSDNLIVGGTTITGPRYQAAAMIKYDSTGAVVWTKNLVGLSVLQLAADNNTGGVFMAMVRAGAANTWDGTQVAATPNSAFYAKCSATGALQWTQPLNVPNNPVSNFGVTADNAGNAYFVVTPSAAGTIGGIAVAAYETILFKTDGTGAPQWGRALHGNTTNSMAGVRVGPKPGGGCLVSGDISGQNTLYLGTGTGTPLLTNGPLVRGFLSSFDAAGTHQWSTSLGTTATAQAFLNVNATAADASGNCYITGRSTSTLQTGGVALNGGFFLIKYDASGAMQWARGQQPATPIANYNDGGLFLAVSNQGATVVTQVTFPLSQPMLLGSLTLRSYYNFVHYNPQGVEQWAVADSRSSYNPSASIDTYFMPGSLGSDARGNVYAAGSAYPRPTWNTPSTAPPAVQLGANITVGNGTIVTRLNAYANTLRGQVYLDLNANGLLDPTEPPFPLPLTGALEQGATTNYFPVTNTGTLQAYASPGSYTLALAQLPTYYLLTQPARGSFTGTLTGSNQVVTGLDFGIVPMFNQADVRISLTPVGVARPGFTTTYRATLENVGTTTANGTVTVTLDSHATYISSTPSGSQTGQTVTWTYSNLAPFARTDFDVLFSLPTNTVVGTVLTSTAAALLAADLTPANNAATLAHTVVGAYDPNFIEVNYQRITPAQVAAQVTLDYVIHFQNLGTANATTVVISDTLDLRMLNPQRLWLVSQSHSCQWSLTSIGPTKALLTVLFPAINLPFRNADVIRSQGFVRFQLNARPNLVLGDIIPNHAGIVFDYNDPVITNTATTTVFLATAAQASHNAPAWEAYPNPATDMVTVAADLAAAGPVRVELLDMLGRSVRQQTLMASAGPLRQTLDLRGLASGVYVLRLTPPTGPATSRQVVRE